MSLVSNYPGGDPVARSFGGNAASSPMHTILENTVDFSEVNVPAADNVLIGVIPAGTLVTAVILEVLTTQATVSVEIGDEDDPNGFLVTAVLGAAGVLRNGTGAYVVGGIVKLYAADKELWVTPTVAALLTAKLRVVVVGASIT